MVGNYHQRRVSELLRENVQQSIIGVQKYSSCLLVELIMRRENRDSILVGTLGACARFDQILGREAARYV